ncbi:hypothetical protein FSP39_015802 [Pinctada imbricata]|uniref:Uncharacterized protein n=1 Tax=Pinctada imbricata TaxID=66713 RepID=A0AA89BT51_PINIB|nr:hypothetical protein FSP39_015802 [Pinctada imbricata]
MSRPLGAASLPFISCIALLAAAILQILGVAASNWSHDGTFYVGLWRRGLCMRPLHVDCYRDDHVEYFTQPWLHAVRGLECLGVVFIAVPLVVLPVYMYIALGLYYKCMMITMCVSSFLAAVSIIIGVSIYAVKVTTQDWSVEWCVFVCIVACGCAFIAFLVLLVAVISKRPPGLKEVHVHTEIYVDPNKPKLYTIDPY